jgi:glyoxylase-like metal-dependent hydrolase (beta-lactamase superfamily II)
MKIDRLILGFLKTNCYILSKGNDYLIIDPADKADDISALIKGNLVGIIITHYHFDHIGALDDLVNKYQVNVYDFNHLNEGTNRIGNFTFEMLKTPGHKEDCISLFFDDKDIMFSGDFIFEGTIGRTDLVGGSFKEMQESIKKVIGLKKGMIIYPGHGNSTTLGRELDNLKSYI